MDLKHYLKMKNKYNAVPKRYNGRLYHSTLEADYAKVLDTLLKGKQLKIVEPQPKYRLDVNGHHIANIIPDFYVVDKDGQESIIEVKGKEQEVWKLKWRLMQALYPQYKYEVVKKGDF